MLFPRQESLRILFPLSGTTIYLEPDLPQQGRRISLRVEGPENLKWQSNSLRVARDVQQITKEWWQTRRAGFDLYISQFVLDEAAAGDAEAAHERLAAIQGLPILDLSEDVVELAGALRTSLALPASAVTDAAHIAIAAVHRMHFLLTWNCTHIANAEMSVAIEEACQAHGFACPVICTPEELMGV